MPIVLAKSWNARGGSHHPAFMSGCLTVSHTCLPSLLSEKMLLFWRDLFLIGREVSWERWENHELGRQERCVTGMRWQVGKGEGIVRWHSWRGGKVVRWQGRKDGRV